MSESSGSPVLKPAKSDARRLTLGDLKEAERLLAAGQASAEELDARYPGWRQAGAELAEGARRLAASYRDAIMNPEIRSYMDSYAAMQRGLADTVIRSTASAGILDGLASQEAFAPRDPDEATRQVANEVRQLAAVAAQMARNTADNAEIAKASLEQMGGLLTSMDALLATTKAGTASADRMAKVIVALTCVLVVLTGAIAYLTWVLVSRPGS
jgi:hypothetical protein